MANLFLYYYKKNWHFQIKKEAKEKIEHFQILLGLYKTVALSLIKKLKMITMMFILMR